MPPHPPLPRLHSISRHNGHLIVVKHAVGMLLMHCAIRLKSSTVGVTRQKKDGWFRSRKRLAGYGFRAVFAPVAPRHNGRLRPSTAPPYDKIDHHRGASKRAATIIDSGASLRDARSRTTKMQIVA